MYKLTKDNQSVIRKSDNACIPFANGNRDYAEYLEWLAEGGIPDPAQTVEEVAQEVLSKLAEEKRKIKSEGITVEGILFDTDEYARLAYMELMFKFIMNPLYVVADWKASEGVWISMDKSMFDKLMTEWELKMTSLFTFVKTKEAEIKSKSTVETLKGVDVKKGV